MLHIPIEAFCPVNIIDSDEPRVHVKADRTNKTGKMSDLMLINCTIE